MKWNSAALLPLLIAMWACAEGGTRGSGISTLVAGNVVSVTDSASAAGAQHGETSLAGIRVRVEGTGARGRTDADGQFTVRGAFEGQITLVFHLPDTDWQARIDLDVPAAGTLTLNNVYLDTVHGEASAESQGVDFEAIITGIDCDGQTLTLISSQHTADDDDQYILRLDTSAVRDAHGNLVPCAALRSGEQASVVGSVNPDGSFGDATVDLKD